MMPPSDSQPPQCAPSHHRCHSALSVPTPKMSSRFGPHATARGGEVRIPPSDSQPPHCAPSHHRCHSALSVPTAKTSSRFGPHVATLGGEITMPPSDSQPPQVSGICVTVLPCSR